MDQPVNDLMPIIEALFDRHDSGSCAMSAPSSVASPMPGPGAAGPTEE
jgi:hypothetical protein